MRKRFTNKLIVAVLTRHAGGKKAKNLYRELDILGPSFTPGRRSSVEWTLPMYKNSKTLKPRTPDLKNLSQILLPTMRYWKKWTAESGRPKSKAIGSHCNGGREKYSSYKSLPSFEALSLDFWLQIKNQGWREHQASNECNSWETQALRSSTRGLAAQAWRLGAKSKENSKDLPSDESSD